MTDRSTKIKADVTDDPLDVNIVGGDITISGADGAVVDGANPLIRATVKDLTNSNPITVAITDGNGDQVTSFGGGTQYTEGDIDTTITGTALLWEGTGNTLRTASEATPLPVSLASVPSHAVTATDLDIRNLSSAQDSVTIVPSGTQAVSGTFWQTTQPVSIATAVPVTDNGGSITVDGTVAVSGSVAVTGTFYQATQPVSIATMPTTPVTGTFWQATQPVSGTVSITGSTVQDIPATTGGLSKFHLVGAGSTNATNIKATAGQVYSITAFNIGATPIYIKLHNTAGTPTAGSGVTDTYLIPGNTAGAGMVINIDKGVSFSTGIGITTVTGITDASAVAIAADTLVLNIYYK